MGPAKVKINEWRGRTEVTSVQPNATREARFTMGKSDKNLSKRDSRKLEALRKRLRELQQRLAGAKKQPDDPREIETLAKDIAAVEAEIARLTGQHGG